MFDGMDLMFKLKVVRLFNPNTLPRVARAIHNKIIVKPACAVVET